MRNEQDNSSHPLLDHQQQVCLLEAFVQCTVADRYNSSLAFLVAVSWHAEEYKYADLSALTMVLPSSLIDRQGHNGYTERRPFKPVLAAETA